jgi:hypothetical protein
MAAKFRIKCPNCGKVANIANNGDACSKCKNPINFSPDSCVYLYRQGSVYGIAGGIGIYVNGEDYGAIGNKELLCFPLPYGQYTFHCAAGMNRKCNDPVINLSPENRVEYKKVYIKPGFWANSFIIEPVDPKLLDL